MATAIGSFTGRLAGLKKWTEVTLIGVGFAGLLLLAVILYIGLAF